jgi:hypothetical protein
LDGDCAAAWAPAPNIDVVNDVPHANPDPDKNPRRVMVALTRVSRSIISPIH